VLLKHKESPDELNGVHVSPQLGPAWHNLAHRSRRANRNHSLNERIAARLRRFLKWDDALLPHQGQRLVSHVISQEKTNVAQLLDHRACRG
jgi:hypothetical protein